MTATAARRPRRAGPAPRAQVVAAVYLGLLLTGSAGCKSGAFQPPPTATTATGGVAIPQQAQALAAQVQDLNRRVARKDVQFVFVSVDPERDTPAVVARYLAHFDPALVGATGERAEMERLTAGLGVGQVRNPGAGDEYTVDHSTAFVLIDPDARLAAYFSAPHDRDALAADLSRLPKGDGHF